MKRTILRYLQTFLFFSILLLVSCRKESINGLNIIAATPHVDNGVLPYPFNWETANFVPTPQGIAPIPVPWGSGVSRRFTDDILTDYKTADGWVMVYNVFNTST